MWKYIDKFADLIGDTLSYRWQKRIGVVSLIVSMVFLTYFPFSKEPKAIFVMSFLALLFGAFSIIASVEAAENSDDAA